MKSESSIIVFRIDDQKFAIPLRSVVRVVRAVAITTIPNSPTQIHGIIDYQGTPLPVLHLRNRLQFPDRPVSVDDRFIIATNSRSEIILPVDSVDGIEILKPDEFTPAGNIFKGLEIKGLLRREDGLILIYDIDALLPATHEEIIDSFIQQNRHDA